MKYRIIKQTDGIGNERIYAQVKIRILWLFHRWLYLTHPSCDLGGQIVGRPYPLYDNMELCTREVAVAILTQHKEIAEKEIAKINYKIKVLEDI